MNPSEIHLLRWVFWDSEDCERFSKKRARESVKGLSSLVGMVKPNLLALPMVTAAG